MTVAPERASHLAAAAATLIAAALVLDDLGTKSLWFDEGLSVAFARMPAATLLETVATREANGSLYLVLLRAWSALGSGEAWLRGLSALAAVLTVPLLHALGVRLFGPLVAAVAAVVLATHPLLLQYGQEARGYALAALAVTASTLALVRAVDRGRRRDWAAWAAALAAACYLHFFAGLVALAHLLALGARGRGLPWRRIAVALVGLGAAVSPLIAFVVRQDRGQIDWVPAASAVRLERFALALSGHAGDTGLVCATVLWLLGAAGVVLGPQRWAHGLVVAWALLPPVAALLASLAKPVFVDRYLLVTLPAVTLLGASGIARLPAWPPRAAAVAVVVALQLTGVERWLDHARKEDWRGAARAIADATTRGDAVACVVAPGCGALTYYLEAGAAGRTRPALVAFTTGGPLGVPPGPLDPARIHAVAAAHDRIWIAVSHIQVGRADRRSERDEVRAILERTHARAVQRAFTGVEIERWDRRSPLAAGAVRNALRAGTRPLAPSARGM